MANSTLDFNGFLERLRDFLVDEGSETYSDDSLAEALRQAAADLGRAYGTAALIAGLDAAAGTTVDALDVDLVVRGAAGYAARMRAVDRADSANLGQNMPETLLEWSKNTLYGFDDQLKQVRLRLLQRSSANPASRWTWDETERNW